MVDNLNVQKRIDGIIDKIFLRFIPDSITPNQVTIVRFIMTPFVCLFFFLNRYDIALFLFVIAASTDFIDGAMARTRNQITDIGKVIDPLADKLLILTVLISIGADYLIVKIIAVFIVFEMVAVLSGAMMSKAIGRPIGANVYGKIKMILQSFGAGLFIIGLIIKNALVVDISIDLLIMAFVFAVLSAVEQMRVKWKNRKDYRVLRNDEKS